MKKIVVALALFVVSTNCFALKEYYALKRSIRSLGMGGAFYGLSDDEYALFYNPAGLANYRGTWELGIVDVTAQASPQIFSALKTITDGSNKQISDIVKSLEQYQGTPLYGNAGVDIPFINFHKKNFGIAFFSDTKFDVAVLGRDFDTNVDVTGISDFGVIAGYATKFMEDQLAIGINAKLLGRAGGKKNFQLVDIASGNKLNLSPKDLGGAGGGVDFDLGSTYELPELPFALVNRASLVINNLLGTQYTMGRQEGPPPALPRTLSLGWVSIFPGYGVIDNFNVLVDFAEFGLGGQPEQDGGARTGSFFKHVNLGVEAPMLNFLAVRAGIHQGYWTLGASVNLRALKIDFATYQEELYSAPGRLPSRRVAMHIVLGIGSAPPPPITATNRAGVREEKEPAKEPVKEETKPTTDPKKEELPPVPPPTKEEKKDEKKVEEKKVDGKRKPQSEEETDSKTLKDETKYIPPGQEPKADADEEQ